MEGFNAIFRAATAAVPLEYFQLPVANGRAIYRERVYCYELYHQLRLRWPNPSDFALNGEIDKAAHPVLKHMGVNGQKPDFLVHRPGGMDDNYAIIEVKPCRVSNNDIKKDIKTLSLFQGTVGYARAFLLIYRDTISECLLTRVRTIAEATEGLQPVELWLHAAAGEAAVHSRTLGER